MEIAESVHCPGDLLGFSETLIPREDGSIRRGVEVLSRLVSVHGAPLFMRSDNGPEFVSLAILEWIAQAGIATLLNNPGKPWQNGTDESFNGKFRDECLSIE